MHNAQMEFNETKEGYQFLKATANFRFLFFFFSPAIRVNLYQTRTLKPVLKPKPKHWLTASGEYLPRVLDPFTIPP